MDVDDTKSRRKPLLQGAVKKKKASAPKTHVVPAELVADMLIG
jgi:hypothetical protein